MPIFRTRTRCSASVGVVLFQLNSGEAFVGLEISSISVFCMYICTRLRHVQQYR